MKKAMICLWVGMIVCAVGCKDSQKIPTQPEAIKQLPESTRLTAPANRVDPDEIDESNYVEMMGRLQGDVNRDQRAMTKAKGE